MDMKRAVWTAVCLALLSSFGAAQAEEVRIGYVDLRKVMTESKVGQKTKTEIEAAIKERQESLKRDEQQLKDMQQAYEKDKLLLSESQKEAKQKEFEAKVRAFQQARAEAQRDIAEQERDFTRKALPQIRAIIKDIAKEKKLTLVFEKNEMPVLYAQDGPDLTGTVIKRFDAKGGG